MIDFYNLIVNFIRSLCICTWSLFLLLYVVVQFYPWFEFYLPLFSRNRCVTSLKTAAMEPSSRENCYKLTSGRSTELKLWSIGGEFNRQTNKFGFSTVYHEFRARFRGKRQVLDNKSQTETHFGKTRLRKETHRKLPLYLDFRSHFEATSPNWFNVFCKILLRSIFQARIINKNKLKSHQLILDTLGRSGAIGYFRNLRSHLTWWVTQVSRFKPRPRPKKYFLFPPITKKSNWSRYISN